MRSPHFYKVDRSTGRSPWKRTLPRSCQWPFRQIVIRGDNRELRREGVDKTRQPEG